MKATIFIPLCLAILMFTSCLKEDDRSYGDPKLQRFWQFEGFFDSEGNPVDTPSFDPDTVFAYDINIVFLWNYSRQRYEIQGQGAFDIFWGEYSSTDSTLSFSSLLTSGLSPQGCELAEYDRVFFNALRNVTSYSILDNELVLNLREKGKIIRFSAYQTQYFNTSSYVIAEIDSMEWSADINYIGAYIFYNADTKEHILSFGGASYRFLDDEMRYTLSFEIYQPPSRGKYYFNNDGLEFDEKGGVRGTCVGRSFYGGPIDTRSTDGFVAITLMNKSFIVGHFEFNTESVVDTIEASNRVTSGEFLIGLSTPAGWFKQYKFD